MSSKSASFCAALVAHACFFCVFVPSWACAAEDPLVLLNWSEYMDPDVMEAFTTEAGIEIVEVFYATDADRDAQIMQADGGEFDIVVVSANRIGLLHRIGWLAPIPEEKVPNGRHIENRWRDAFPVARDYAVPYFWGTIAIAYRKDEISTPITQWMQVMRPNAELCNKLVVTSDGRELIDHALLALGYLGGEITAAHLDEARLLLLEQKPCVLEYLYPDINENSQIVTGEIAASILYNGDAMYVASLDPQIEVVVPKDGMMLWADYLVVPESSNKKQAAYAFIDYINRPEVAARLALYTYYATPNAAARAHLPDDYLNDTTINPPADSFETARLVRELPPRLLRNYNAIAAEILSGTEADQ